MAIAESAPASKDLATEESRRLPRVSALTGRSSAVAPE
jgi:hypothetical protein